MASDGSGVKPAADRGVLLCLSLSMLLASLGTSIANIALPALALAFDAPIQRIQWVVTSYLATLTLFAVFAGRLGDILGRRKMLVAGLALFSVASMACGASGSFWMLLLARAVQGAGAAFLMVLTIALVRDLTGGDRIGRAMGLLGTMSALGTALGPSLGGVLIASAGWRAVFFVLVPIGVLAIGLAFRVLPAPRPSQTSAMISFAALRTEGFASRLIANLLVAAVMMTTLIVGPFYLGPALGLPETMVGLVMAVGPLISIFTGVPSGRLVDLRGARAVILIGLAGLTTGAFALAVLPAVFGLGGYIAAIAVLTPGYQLFQAANNTLVMADAPEDQRGAVSGLLSLSRNLGLIVGASVMGAVFSHGVGTAAMEDALPGAITEAMQLTFAVAGALMVLAMVLARRRSGDGAPAGR